MTVNRQPARTTWETFLRSVPRTSFLQSWGWGEFQRRVGRRPVRMIFEGKRDSGGGGPGLQAGQGSGIRVLAACQALVHRYPLGFVSLYVPHGPVIAPGLESDPQVMAQVTASLRGLAEETQAVFVRSEPPVGQGAPVGLPVRKVDGIQPSATSVLDLARSEEDLLERMHQKTRYNIRLAERSRVRVTDGGAELTETFLELLRETQSREQVRFFSAGYFRALWREPELASQLTHYIGWIGERPAAAILILRTHDTAVYLHGGSSREQREKMAPYLVHWTAIQVARRQGLQWYDFRGVAPASLGHHPWAGFSRFKRGFGGVDVEYPGAFDWIRRPAWYALYRVAQRTRV